MTGDGASLDFRLLAGDRFGVLAALRGLSRFEESNSLRGDERLWNETDSLVVKLLDNNNNKVYSNCRIALITN